MYMLTLVKIMCINYTLKKKYLILYKKKKKIVLNINECCVYKNLFYNPLIITTSSQFKFFLLDLGLSKNIYLFFDI